MKVGEGGKLASSIHDIFNISVISENPGLLSCLPMVAKSHDLPVEIHIGGCKEDKDED